MTCTGCLHLAECIYYGCPFKREPQAAPDGFQAKKEKTHDGPRKVQGVQRRAFEGCKARRGMGEGGNAGSLQRRRSRQRELVEIHAIGILHDVHHQSECDRGVRGREILLRRLHASVTSLPADGGKLRQGRCIAGVRCDLEIRAQKHRDRREAMPHHARGTHPVDRPGLSVLGKREGQHRKTEQGGGTTLILEPAAQSFQSAQPAIPMRCVRDSGESHGDRIEPCWPSRRTRQGPCELDHLNSRRGASDERRAAQAASPVTARPADAVNRFPHRGCGYARTEGNVTRDVTAGETAPQFNSNGGRTRLRPVSTERACASTARPANRGGKRAVQSIRMIRRRYYKALIRSGESDLAVTQDFGVAEFNSSSRGNPLVGTSPPRTITGLSCLLWSQDPDCRGKRCRVVGEEPDSRETNFQFGCVNTGPNLHPMTGRKASTKSGPQSRFWIARGGVTAAMNSARAA